MDFFFSQFRHWKGKSASLSLCVCIAETDVIVEMVAFFSFRLSLSMESPLRLESATSKALAPNYNYYRPRGRVITIQREIKTSGKCFHRNVEHRMGLNGSNITSCLLYRNSCRKCYPTATSGNKRWGNIGISIVKLQSVTVAHVRSYVLVWHCATNS